jgi:DNA-binding transcriptional LysR family regulator
VKTELKSVALVESYGVAIEMARAGLGVAYTNSIIAAPSVNDQSLYILEKITASPKEGYYLKTRMTDKDSLAGEFANWLRALIHEALL